MGKSLLALQFARHAAMHEHQRVLFASLEMSDSETAQRHLAAESGVDPDRLHLGSIKADDWPALLNASSDAAGVPFHLLDDGDLSLFKLRAQARQIAVRHDELRLIVVDYLQLMRAERPSGNRVEDVSEFSRGLKRLARELELPGARRRAALPRRRAATRQAPTSSQTCANPARSRPTPTAC